MSEAASSATPRWFCTYFDSRYLARGLALHESLRRHEPAARLVAVCLDERARRALEARAPEGLVAVSLGDLERFDPDLPRVRPTRSRVEYYFTLTPVLPLYVLAHFPEAGAVTYLDADLYFFSSPGAVFAEIGEAPVALIPHRFPPSLGHLERFGRYNVGWLTFRRSEVARHCLEWWRRRCLEWCHDRCEEGRFADQKYLDEWPQRFGGIHVIRHPGANLAPWNVAAHRVAGRRGAVRVDGRPLVFFHFHGLRELRPWLWDPNLARYGAALTPVLRRAVFRPYIRHLRRLGPDVSAGSGQAPPADRLRALCREMLGLFARRYLWVAPPAHRQAGAAAPLR